MLLESLEPQNETIKIFNLKYQLYREKSALTAREYLKYGIKFLLNLS